MASHEQATRKHDTVLCCFSIILLFTSRCTSITHSFVLDPVTWKLNNTKHLCHKACILTTQSIQTSDSIRIHVCRQKSFIKENLVFKRL